MPELGRAETPTDLARVVFGGIRSMVSVPGAQDLVAARELQPAKSWRRRRPIAVLQSGTNESSAQTRAEWRRPTGHDRDVQSLEQLGRTRVHTLQCPAVAMEKRQCVTPRGCRCAPPAGRHEIGHDVCPSLSG